MNDTLEVSVSWALLRYILSGAWLIFLYILFLCMVFFSLGTYQFLQGFVDIEVGDPSIAMRDFEPHKCDISGIKSEAIEKMESALVTLPCLRRPALHENKNMTTSYKIKSIQFQQKVLGIELKSQKEKLANLVGQLLGKKVNEDEAKNLDLNSCRAAAKETKDKTRIFLKENCLSVAKSVTSIKADLDKTNAIGEAIRNVATDSQFYQRLLSLMLGNGSDTESGEASEAKAEGDNGGGDQATMNTDDTDVWAIPEIFISLFLALSMGGLGSLLTVTIHYLNIKREQIENVRFSIYLFRPMLGAITALAVYIAIKSGQIGISGDTVTELSPYLLSFICVLAGLMAEPVYKRLTNYAEKIIS